ncbi:winged helix-turn-helix domain-containing protein [Aquimarina sediminis]|uniref:winged helix-turn-helix domain-containing protein n=1 Tax=Aquimarina sediminis TaxID=2070536 RepID=UPI000CA037C8|nr:winged helix-turn-helix domain-containing protein [Aquimarina sediminis]
MQNISTSLFGALIGVTFLFFGCSESERQKEEFTEIVKIALRDAGNQLLLANKDSTSLVLPVVLLENSKYQLSFENEFSFDPADLVSIIKESFQKAGLPKQYSVEVLQCFDREVPFSYLIRNNTHKDIIPCRGRILKDGCYSIEVHFNHRTSSSSFNWQNMVFVSLALVVIFLLLFLYKQKQSKENKALKEDYIRIGSFQFYPEQHKLIKQFVEINLSKKECELLEIFVARPNQTIKRDELVKKVWEDNGVIVGRSLDTYISKLRKKLKDDDTIRFINVHGVGYKLEIK